MSTTLPSQTPADLGTCCELLPDDQTCTGRLIILESDGPIWIVECDQCGYEAGVPARLVNPEISKRRLLDLAGLPSMFASKPFEQTADSAAARAALRDWIVAYESPDRRLPAPALWGQPGRGKSHLAVYLCQRMIERYRCRLLFRSMAGLLDDLQGSFGDTNANQALWNRVVRVDVLVLDDLGAEQATDWRRDRLARLVDERYQHNLPIVVATNYPPSTWEQLLDARTASRLAAMTFGVELSGVDRRTTPLADTASQQPLEDS